VARSERMSRHCMGFYLEGDGVLGACIFDPLRLVLRLFLGHVICQFESGVIPIHDFGRYMCMQYVYRLYQ